MGQILRFNLASLDAPTPPTEFRLLAAGINPYLKTGMAEPGQVVFDDGAASELMRRFAASGRDKMAIDYDHATYNEHIQDKIAAGWFVPEVRNGELWATAVSWTPKALQHLQNKEFRFYSPSIERDEDGRALSLHPVALTNDPAMCNLRPLMAASHQKDKTMKTLLRALDLEEGADEVTALSAVQPLKDLKAQILTLSGKATVGEAMGALHAMKAQAERSIQLSAELETVKAEKNKAEIDGLVNEAIVVKCKEPSDREYLLTLAATLGPIGFRAFVEALPKRSAPAIEKAAPASPAQTVDQGLAAILRNTGVSVEDFNAHTPKYRAFVNPTDSEGT